MPLLVLLRVVCALNAKSALNFFNLIPNQVELVSSKILGKMKSGIKKQDNIIFTIFNL